MPESNSFAFNLKLPAYYYMIMFTISQLFACRLANRDFDPCRELHTLALMYLEEFVWTLSALVSTA
jgi:hypothetical protein